ncbi:MAG: hypothetical protein LBQ79_14840 [Deltaproteobacteria bacterium]|jgi:uncharacterized protein YfaS (alpha-2-macroglobulin family)|nr:hypothetical protein [Deltaproteobacteria bacterium]
MRYRTHFANFRLRAFFRVIPLLLLALALAGCPSDPPAGGGGAAPPAAAPDARGAGDGQAAGSGAEPQVPSDAGAAAAQSAPLPPADEPLKILQFIPRGDVRSFTQAAVMFSQPMAELGTFDSADQSLLTVDPPLPGRVVWINQFTLAFVPDKPLLGSMSVKVTLSPGLKSLSGAALPPGTHETSFTLPALAVEWEYSETGNTPEDALRPAVTAMFNQPVDPESIGGRSFFRWGPEDSRGRAPALWTRNAGWSGSGMKPLRAVSGADVPKGTRWRLVIEKGAALGEGLPPLASDFEVANGETYGKLAVSFHGLDRDGTGEADGFLKFPENDSLNVNFSNPVRMSEAVGFIEMEPPHPSFAVQKEIWEGVAASRAGAGGGDGPGAAGASAPADAGEVPGEPREDDTVQGGLYFWGRWTPQTRYTLTFRKGMPDVFGQTLAEDRTFRFRTGSFAPSVQLLSRGGVMESAFPAVVPVAVRNMASAPVFGKVMTFAETARFLNSWYYNMGYGPATWVPQGMRGWLGQVMAGSSGARTLGVKPSGDSSKAQITQPVNLSELLDGRERDGVVFAGAGTEGAPGSDGPSVSFGLFQVTDLGITVKLGTDRSLGWVTRLSDGRGVADAEVGVMDCAGRELWTGATGPEGLAELPGGQELLERVTPSCVKGAASPTLFFSASKDGERIFWSLGWNDAFYGYGQDVADYRDPMSPDWVEAFLLTSQPIYRPGETAGLKIIARRFSGDALKAPDPATARAVIVGPDDEAVWDGPVEVGEYGTASLEWKIPEGAPYGDWKVILDLNPGAKRPVSSMIYSYRETDYATAGNFRVSFYRAPAFELALGEMKDAYAGDRVDFSVAGSYHYGAPLDAGEAEFELRHEPAWGFAPPGFGPEWRFTARTALEKDDEGGWASDPVPSGVAAEGSAVMAADGRASFSAEIPGDGPPVPRLYSLTVSARDKDSRTVSQTGSFTAHPAGLYAGIRTEGFIGEESRPVKISVVAADPGGTVRSGETVKVSLYRRSWSDARRLSPGGYWNRVAGMTDTLVSETEVKSGSEPATVEMVPVKAGTHFAVAEVKDSRGRTAMASCDFYVAGPGAMWRAGDEEAVELAADRGEYRPGDTVRILVQSPFESGTGLFTVERGGVREARTFDLSGGAPVLEFPVGEDDAPSVYVSVVLARGRVAPPPKAGGGADLGRPAFRRGYLTDRVLSERDKLNVDVTPAEAEAVPGAEARVRIRVTDASGRPFSDGEAALVAVDAGLVQIGGSEAFHPETLLWKALPLGVRSSASLASVLDARDWSGKGGAPGTSPAPPGGGGIEAAGDSEVRKDFRSVAHFEPGLKLDADGEAESSFTLPDNLTTFRLFAVVTGRGRSSGTGEGKLTVTKDLVLRASLPNHLTAGDEFEASAIVTSRAAGEGELSVTVRPREGIELLEDPVKKVTVRPGESVEVSFSSRAVLAAGVPGAGGPDAAGPGSGDSPGGGPGSGAGRAGPRPYDPARAGALTVGFDAELGGSADRALFTVPVGEAGRMTADATFMMAAAGSAMPEARLPEGADPSRGGMELVFSPGIEGLLDAPLAALGAYPYNCLEQSTSKAAGALYELRLSRGDGGAASARRDELRKRVTEQIALISSRSMDGGFAAWPGAARRSRSPVLTAWVLDFLLEARADGFGVEEGLVNETVGYLVSELGKAEPPGGRPDGEGTDGAPCSLCGSDAARLYVMGAAGRASMPMEASLEPFYARRASLNLTERLFLLRAVDALPPSRVRTGELMELIPMVASEIEISGVTARVKDPSGRENPNLWMTGRDDLGAQLLLALSEAAPHHEFLPALILGSVSSGRGGDFGGTNRSVTILRGVWNFLEARRTASGVSRRPPLADGGETAAGAGAGGSGAPAPEGPALDLAVKVLLGGKTVLDGRLAGPRDPELRVRMTARELLDAPPPSWSVEGRGEAWAFQRLTWAPGEPDLSARGTRGLVLTRTFQRVKPRPGPAGESSFRRGEVVKVTMTLVTAVPRYNLAVEDPVPAGLEPVDFRLKDQNPNLAELLAASPDVEDPWRGYWYWYDHEEIRPDSIRLFADYLEPGVYTYSYLARPVTPGSYILPGPYAEEMYNPENYGRGAGLKITVTR